MRNFRLSGLTLVLALLAGCAANHIASPSRLADKTVLSFEYSHGNQIEYYDSAGHCFLWYPGNQVILAGQWKANGENICFIYGKNTYNPVTGSSGDKWQCMAFTRWRNSVVDVGSGDLFSLSTEKAAPHRLAAWPKLESLTEVKPAR